MTLSRSTEIFTLETIPQDSFIIDSYENYHYNLISRRRTRNIDCSSCKNNPRGTGEMFEDVVAFLIIALITGRWWFPLQPEPSIHCVVIFIIGTLIAAIFLWIGMKLTRIHGTFLAMIIVAVVSSLVRLIPIAGGILSIIAMFVLINALTDSDFWPDAVFMVIVAWGIPFLLSAFFILCMASPA
ncbi:MAG: hypothetical protein SVO26_02555 [Chloroflexota bacterium]|nr:hypothetical protein [Chloroflexota bacterium]